MTQCTHVVASLGIYLLVVAFLLGSIIKFWVSLPSVVAFKFESLVFSFGDCAT